MKHSERFTNAVTKLYNAFHNGTLNAYDCQKCAIGSLCDGSDLWNRIRTSWLSQFDPSKYKGEVKELIDSTGYSPQEILRIEKRFVSQFDGLRTADNKEYQFKGLCAVVEYLCELEGIPNVMDYTKLFESNSNKLETVFV